MCGIIGLVSKNKDLQNIYILTKGLYMLLNRGYDSVGLSYICNDNIKCIKYCNKPEINCYDLLINTINEQKIESNIFIGHSRWATHGRQSDENSHPHTSFNKNIVLVHNGIIDNFSIIKKKLQKHGYKFNSDTDSEVIVNLIEYNYLLLPPENRTEGAFINIISSLHYELEGTWGLLIMNNDFPEILFGYRHGSPLLIGQTNDEIVVASEKNGFPNTIHKYFALESNDVCTMKYDYKNNEFNINTKRSKKLITLMETKHQDTPDPYKFWLEKEINEQPISINRALGYGSRILDDNIINLGGLYENKDKLKNIENIVIVGCGTSYYAGLLGKYYFNELTNIKQVIVIDGSEICLDYIPYKNTAMLILSQSGETKDLFDCIDMAKKNGIITIGIINSVDSTLSRMVDCGCYLHAEREVSVASTKSFSNQVIILSLISIYFAQLNNINMNICDSYINDTKTICGNIKELLYNINNNNLISDNIISILNKKSIFVLGKQKSMVVAMEGALKIKEVSYIHAEGYSSGGLKHGPFALLDKDCPVILLVLDDEHLNNNNNCYQEIISRDAEVICITNIVENSYKNSIVIPNNNKYNELLLTIVIQNIALKLAIANNINPDRPRNLAKCVTVG